MPIHDWTLVDAGIFHAFHLGWIAAISKSLNDGLLPQGFYALPEQVAGSSIPDVLTLHASPSLPKRVPLPPPTGGILLADAPPKVARKLTVDHAARQKRRTLTIRHISEHRLIAMLEIVSPTNKDRAKHVADFAGKVVSALDHGVHVMVLDLYPPGKHDPSGMHGAIWDRLQDEEEPYVLPADKPLTLSSYMAEEHGDIYLEHLAPGQVLPPMPLFLYPDRYIYVPLEETYQEAYRSMPSFWRDVLEGREPDVG